MRKRILPEIGTFNGAQRWLALAALVFLVAGAALTVWTAQTWDRRMRDEALVTTRVLAQAMDAETLSVLTGSEADLTSPAYQKLKAELGRACRAWTQCRFIYVTGRRADGAIFFYADSEPPDSDDYSPPGQIFDEASETFRGVFDAGRDVVEGPLSDRWGVWVSALTALPTAAGERRFVLGMDIDARDWNRAIVARCIEPVSVTLFLLALIAVFFFWQQRTEGEKRRIAASEAAIRRSEQQYRRVIETIPDIFCRIDAAGRIALVNAGAAHLLGYASADEMIGQPMTIFWDDPAGAGAMQEKLLKDGALQGWEFLGRRKDGSRLVIETSVYLLYDEAGQPAGCEGIGRDVTERKLVEETLRQAKEAAESANQAKSAFLAAMSHEIRTPMNGVMGMTSLLLDTEMTAEQREYAEAIRVSTEALIGIINEVLDFSKIEAGRLDLEIQPFDVRECIEGVLDLAAAQASAKALDLVYQIDDAIPDTVVSDVTRLRQILVNLLSNAVKFTEKGEIILRVERGDACKPATNGAPIRCELHFSVQDSGIGIPPERMERLFKSFSQVDASTTRRYGGTGLGLAISKRLSELLGGRMWVESEVGKGSIFHFTIQAEISASRPAGQVETDHAALQGKRVLIVDDNATNRRVLSLQTQSWGMLPRDTASPHQALEWLRQGETFDVALLDMLMPEIDGLALAQEIRRLEAGQENRLPLVMLTSLGRHEADSVELAGYLNKPIKPAQLRRLLLEICAGRGKAAAPATPAAPRLERLADTLPLRILIAEDHPVNQKLALQMVAKMGYRADIAANGLEAVQAVERQPYDAILMDVQMPEMDGLEATRQIRKRLDEAGRPQPRIIAMTANAMAGDREACLAAGMNDFVSKPVRVEDLLDALRRCRPAPDSARVASAPAQAGGDAPVDWTALNELRALRDDGAPDFAQEMIGLYLGQSPLLLQAIREAIQAGDEAGLKIAAHTLKGSSRTMGLAKVGARSAQLEELALAGRMTEARECLALLEREFKQAADALQHPPPGWA